jgi:hypothetical protein
MINRTTSTLRHALVAALLASSTLSAGCHRAVVVMPSELPRLVAAQSEDASELDVVDVQGGRQTVANPVDKITLLPPNRRDVFDGHAPTRCRRSLERACVRDARRGPSGASLPTFRP